MAFIRPEIRDTLTRWRAALIGGLIACFGAYWTLRTGGLFMIIGVVVLLLGLALLWDGVRRARFPAGGGGLGVVELDERRISYLGPLGGGSLSLNELVRIQIVRTDNGQFRSDVLWQFMDRDGQRLAIPTNAEGADRIFDALAAFHGVDYEAVTAASGTNGKAERPQSYLIWQESPRALH